MQKLRVAIIGLGHQANEDHIPGILESQFAELVAICDTDKEKLKESQISLGVNAYTDFRKLMDSEKLDFIIAVTPHNIYKKIIEEATARNIHILKEKPFARNLPEAIYFKKLCNKKNIHLMTTLQRRFNPIYTTFFQLVDKIGEPYFVDAKYSLYVDSPTKGWRASKNRAGGGCIIDMGYHIIDMLIWYFGLPDAIHADYSNKSGEADTEQTVENTAIIMFKYNKGLHGSLIISRFYPPKTEYIRVVGTRGIIEVERGQIRRLKNNGEVAEILSRKYAWPVAAANQIDYFCRVINGERDNIGSPDHHLKHASFIDACYQSKIKGAYINPNILLNKYNKKYKK